MDIKFYYIREEALDTADTVPYTLYFAFDAMRIAYDDSQGIRREINRFYLYPTEDVRRKSKDFDFETLYFVIESNRLYVFDYEDEWVQLGPDYFYYFEIPYVVLTPNSDGFMYATLSDNRFRDDSTPTFIIDPSLRDLISDDDLYYNTYSGACTITLQKKLEDPCSELYGRLVVSNYKGTIFGGSESSVYTNDHTQLSNRDAIGSHPIEAISGLEELDEQDIVKIWKEEFGEDDNLD